MHTAAYIDHHFVDHYDCTAVLLNCGFINWLQGMPATVIFIRPFSLSLPPRHRSSIGKSADATSVFQRSVVIIPPPSCPVSAHAHGSNVQYKRMFLNGTPSLANRNLHRCTSFEAPMVLAGYVPPCGRGSVLLQVSPSLPPPEVGCEYG